MTDLTSKPRLRTVTLLRDRVRDWDAWPMTVPVVRSLDKLEITSRVLFLVGQNGSGKSTLVEAIAAAHGLGGEGGSRNIRTSTTDENSRIGRLADALRLSWSPKKVTSGYFLRAETFFNIATYLDGLPGGVDPYGGRSLHHQSHGESFLALLTHRLGPGGFYVLDEPEAALSIQRQLTFLVWMRDRLQGSPDTQMIVATHSPVLLAFPGAQILSCDGGTLETVAYEDTDAYVLTSRFLRDPRASIARLWADADREPDDG